MQSIACSDLPYVHPTKPLYCTCTCLLRNLSMNYVLFVTCLCAVSSDEEVSEEGVFPHGQASMSDRPPALEIKDVLGKLDEVTKESDNDEDPILPPVLTPMSPATKMQQNFFRRLSRQFSYRKGSAVITVKDSSRLTEDETAETGNVSNFTS